MASSTRFPRLADAAWVLALPAVSLAACSAGAVKSAVMNSPVGMSPENTLALQRPALPNTDLIAWTEHDRMYRSVVVDYVSGMSQDSYLFAKANQRQYRPRLEWALDRAGLLATTPAAARYALQVEFVELKNATFGVDFAASSVANYRIVERSSGSIVFEAPVKAGFIAVYPGLNEDDFAKAYGVSKPGVRLGVGGLAKYALGEGVLVELINNNTWLSDLVDGDVVEASQATWDDVTQAFVWTTGVSLLAGPALIVKEQLDPTNYIAFAGVDSDARSAPRAARQGALSEAGFGSRSGGERARQADAQMMAQSLTRFMIDLAVNENVRFVTLLPCGRNAEVEDMKVALTAAGQDWRTESCDPAQLPEPARGLGYTRMQ